MERQHQQQEETITVKQQAVLSESYRLRHDNGRQVYECCCQQRRPRRRKRIRQTMLSGGVMKNVWTVILVVVLLLCTHLNRIEYYDIIHHDGGGRADSTATKNLFFWSQSSSKQRRQWQPFPFLVVSAAAVEIQKLNNDGSDLSSSSSMQQHSTTTTTVMGEVEAEEKDVEDKIHFDGIDDIATTTTKSSSVGGNDKARSTPTKDDDDDDDNDDDHEKKKKKDDDSLDANQRSSTPTPSSSSSSTPLVLDTDTDDSSSKPTASSSDEENNESSSCSAASASASLSSSSEEDTCQANYRSLSSKEKQKENHQIASEEKDKDALSKAKTADDNDDLISKTHGNKRESNAILSAKNCNKVPAFFKEAKERLEMSNQRQQRKQQQIITTKAPTSPSQESDATTTTLFDYASYLEQCQLYSMVLHHNRIVSDYDNWCQSYEMTRLLSNEEALRTTTCSDDAPIITRSSLPSDLLTRLREFYNDNTSIATTHLWSEGESILYTNPWNSKEPPQYIQVSHDETDLKDDLFDSIESMWMEQVGNSPIVSFSTYDIEIRMLYRSAIISPHTLTTELSSFTSGDPNHALGVAIVVLDIVDEKDHDSSDINKKKVNKNNDKQSSSQPSWIWEVHHNSSNNITYHEDDPAGTSSTAPILSSFSLQAGDILFIENANHVVMGAPYPLLHSKVTYMELYFSTTKKHDTSKTTKTTRTKSNVKRDYLNARRQRQQSQNNKSLEETASSASSVTSGSSSSLVASQSYVDAVPPTSQFSSSTSTAIIPHYLTSPLERKLWNISRPTETKVSIQQVLKTSGTSFLSKKEMTIHRAAALGDVTQMQLLVEKYGSSILQKKDSNGWQPLHEAARSGEVEAIQFLLDHKVEVNVRTNRGKGGNALYWAAKANGVHHPSVKLLEEHGAILQKPLVRIV